MKQSANQLKPFLPALYFVLRFVALYVAGNLLYGWMVSSYDPAPDPVTSQVAVQSAGLLTLTIEPVTSFDRKDLPNSVLSARGKNILAIYEGCNGLNVMIVFLSFVLALGPYAKSMTWFIPAGLLVIHLMNLLRVWGLFLVAVKLPEQFYFVHKYLFTSILYAVVFVLWFIWIRLTSTRPA